MERLLTIGQLADLSGVKTSTIRYYEMRRLLPKARRTPAGYRLYPRAGVSRLKIVRNAQQFGFSLADIASFLQVRDAGGRPCLDVRAKAQDILKAVDRQVNELLVARRRMRRTLQEWDRALANTPADVPARLLERLPDGKSPRRRRLGEGSRSNLRP